MRPPTTFDNHRDEAIAHIERPSQRNASFTLGSPSSDFDDGLIVQLGHAMTGAGVLAGAIRVPLTSLRDHVLSVGIAVTEKQVTRANTDAIVAAVKHPDSVRDRANIESVTEPVGSNMPPSWGSECAVAIGLFACEPDPAGADIGYMWRDRSVFIDVLPEPHGWVFWAGVPVRHLLPLTGDFTMNAYLQAGS